MKTRIARSSGQPQQAFTRAELCALLAAVALLASILAPALVGSAADSERAACFNNLRLVGRGMAGWSAEFQERVPWRVPQSEGGTFASSKPGNAWFEYSAFSNHFGTPKILLCPSDPHPFLRAATNFTQFVSAGFRNNSVSYAINLEVFPETSETWVSADYNFKTTGSGTCSAGVLAQAMNSEVQQVLGWTNAIHGISGHLLLKDGGVVFSDSTMFREIATRYMENGSTHILNPH